MLGQDRPQGREDIPYGLVELDFSRIPAKDIDEDALQLLVQHVSVAPLGVSRARHVPSFP
jgi:hypothetical protein